MFSPRGTKSTPINIKEHCTEVVLVHDLIFDVKPLLFHEVAGPQELWGSIICPNYFVLIQATSIDFSHLDILLADLLPKYIVGLVWIRQFWCMAYKVSTHHLMIFRVSYHSNIGMNIVQQI